MLIITRPLPQYLSHFPYSTVVRLDNICFTSFPYTAVTGEEPPPPMYNFPCGMVSGVLASIITQPFDVIKTRMQVKPQTYPTLRDTLTTTIRQSGLKGLFTGFVPRATRRTLMAAFTWAFYEEVSLNGLVFCLCDSLEWLVPRTSSVW